MTSRQLPSRHREAMARAIDASMYCANPDDVRSLTAHLYQHWYAQLSSSKATGWSHRVAFVTRLRQALTHAANGRAMVSSRDVVQRQALDHALGYWSVWSPSGPPVPVSGEPTRTTGTVRRVYWNVMQQGAPALVHDLVATLPDQLRWSFKVPVSADDFLRPDALVLYAEDQAWSILQPLVASLAVAHRHHLHPEVPPLTSWIDDGVASAIDPGVAGESFGLTLCRCIAEVLVQARAQSIVPANRPLGRPSLASALERRLYGGLPGRREKRPCGPRHSRAGRRDRRVDPRGHG